MVLRPPKKPDKPKPDKPTGPSGPSGPTAPTAVTAPTRPPVPANVTAATPFRETGNTDRASFRAALRRTINGLEPPPYKEADAIYEELAPYGLTRLGAAMAWIERKNDTYSGYYPQSHRNLWAVKTPKGAWEQYGSYREAAKAWAKLVLGKTYADLTTLSQFIHRYAPSFENDTEKYVRMAAEEINALPSIDGGVPTPQPEPRDVVDAILNGASTDDSYGFKHPTDLPYYAYFEGHGGHANQHTGIDATTSIGQPLYSPIAGTAVCGGSGNGNGAWGQGCAAFGDTMGRGAGRVEILADDGRRSLILGHTSRALVRPGDKVRPGQQVAEAGGMNGPHVHIEAREWDGTQYWIRDPRTLFPGKGKPAVSPVPYVWDSPTRNLFTVTVDHDTAVHQRADPASPKLYALAKGKTVEAVAVVPGNDQKSWWLLTDDGRLPRFRTSFEIKVG